MRKFRKDNERGLCEDVSWILIGAVSRQQAYESK
jgi:hypothetical protein